MSKWGFPCDDECLLCSNSFHKTQKVRGEKYWTIVSEAIKGCLCIGFETNDEP